jgi:Protein of unknown function (DUF3575)
MPMIFRFVCATIILLFSCSIDSNAQAKLKETTSHDITLRFNPLSFLETDANVMLGIGYQLHRRVAITIDPGYIFYRPFDDPQNRSSSVSGIKIRSDVRLFFAKSRKRGRYIFFVGPEFHYKYVSANRWGDFGINCLGGMCAYNQRAQYKEVKKEIGGAAKMGTQLRVFNDRWKIEFYWGIGFKFKRFEETNLPVGGSFLFEPDHGNIFENTDENAAYPIIPGGVKIIFLLK